MSIDIICPQFFEIDFLQITVVSPGIANYLEYPHQETLITGASVAPPMELFHQFQDPLWRGVFGYVSFGYGTTNETHWREPQYINWMFTEFNPVGQTNMARIWGRKGTSLYWECAHSDRSAFKAVVRKSDQILFEHSDLPPP